MQKTIVEEVRRTLNSEAAKHGFEYSSGSEETAAAVPSQGRYLCEEKQKSSA